MHVINTTTSVEKRNSVFVKTHRILLTKRDLPTNSQVLLLVSVLRNRQIVRQKSRTEIRSFATNKTEILDWYAVPFYNGNRYWYRYLPASQIIQQGVEKVKVGASTVLISTRYLGHLGLTLKGQGSEIRIT